MEQRHKIWWWLIAILFALVFITIGIAIGFELACITCHAQDLNGTRGQPRGDNLVYIEQNSLVAVVPASMIDSRVLGSLAGPSLTDKELKEKLTTICGCESQFDEKACDERYGKNEEGYCKAGNGWCGIIPSTGKYCEEKLGRQLDLFNKKDNWDCAFWLLKNEGTRHWGYEGSSWGSFKCWSKYE